MKEFSYTTHEAPRYTAVTLIGRLDLVAAETFEKEIATLADIPNRNVFIDVSQLNYISSAGLRALLVCAKAAQRNQGKVCLIGVRDMIQEVLQISGFLSLFEVYPTFDDAEAMLM